MERIIKLSILILFLTGFAITPSIGQEQDQKQELEQKQEPEQEQMQEPEQEQPQEQMQEQPQMQEPQQVIGKVLMNSTQEVVANVVVEVDEQEDLASGEDGIFQYSTIGEPTRPKKVSAYKEGLEIAAWEFEKRELVVYMRVATIKTLTGSLKDHGKALANQIITLNGNDSIKFKSDDKGEFTLKIPYSKVVDKNSLFTVNGQSVNIKDIRENASKATITLSLELQNTAKTELTQVKVVDENEMPYSRTIVTISGESYITGPEGIFSVDKVSMNNEDWSVDGKVPTTIEQSESSGFITVLVLSREGLLALAASEDSLNVEMVDTLDTSGQADSVFKREINDLITFYNAQASEFAERNKQISSVIDSLSTITELDTAKRDEYLAQVEALSETMGSTSADFNELQSNSLVLIERLRSLLLKQEEKIRLIELERELQARKFRNNLLLVLSGLCLATLLVVILIFVARRISARKKIVEQVKDQLAEAQSIAKIASMTYYFKNKQHEYSDQFFRLLGINDEERIKRIQKSTDQIINNELIQEEDLVKVNDAFAHSLQSSEPLAMEIKVKSDDKRELFVDLRAKVEENGSGKPVAISSTIQDITEKKEREFQLIEARNSAEKANQEKEDFLSTMSHEIRTPLNGIIGLTDHLINSKPPDHLVENLKTLKFSADHLLSLVNDVLDYNKIRAGKMVLSNKTFSLKEYMTGTVKAMSLIAQHKGLSLELNYNEDVPHMVFGDNVRLNQVITNLLNNAIKFTEHGKVTLSLENHQAIDGKVNVYFNVADTGIGIESSKLDRIFESFEQEDISTANKHGGTGLGLAISRQLVKLFGGELFVKSQQGVGSEFYFTIPFTAMDDNEVEEHQGGASELSEADYSDLNILCVEDNEVNQLVISQYFENWNMKYSFASTGEEAMEKFAKESFDIVFMDINLPDTKGDQVVLKLKEEYPDSECSFVAMTADTGKILQDAMKRGGMTEHLNKPFSSDELKSIIYKCGSKKVTN